MIADLKPYPAMKDSGVEWLGEVPKHWEVAPLCSIAQPKSVTEQQGRELLSVYLNRGVIRFSEVQEKRTNVTSEDLSKYQAVDPGDFVLNNQQAWRGSVGVSRHTGIVSPAYLVLDLDTRIESEFANLLFRGPTMVAQYLIASKGVGSIQRNLYWPHLKRVSTLLPPLPEQAAIVRYLDHVDRRVRRLTRAKRKLIALLTEQKQAIIHRAVTHGLDPDVPLKDSGVEWLGEVPEHWEVVPGRACIYEKAEPNTGMVESTVLSLSYGRIIVKPKEKLRGLVPESFETYQVIDPGDVICRPTDLQNDRTSLRFGIAGDRGIITSAYMCIRTLPRLDGRYGHLLLHAYDLKKVFYGFGSGLRQNLSWEDFKYLPCVVPPLPEQTAIVEYLDQATADIDTTISRAEREIDLLNEYRTRLIADVVTGKLDVRDAAAALPEVDPLAEADDADDLDADLDMDADELDETLEEAEA